MGGRPVFSTRSGGVVGLRVVCAAPYSLTAMEAISLSLSQVEPRVVAGIVRVENLGPEMERALSVITTNDFFGKNKQNTVLRFEV